MNATVALVGNPNCGKTALFNALTGGRQKVANYPGVTVEKKIGRLATPAGRSIQSIPMPDGTSEGLTNTVTALVNAVRQLSGEGGGGGL